MSLDVPASTLVALLLVIVRVSAWLAVAPPFNSRAVPTIVKVALALLPPLAAGVVLLPHAARVRATAPAAAAARIGRFIIIVVRILLLVP